MSKIIFEEKQYFRQWWVWLIVILGFAANVYAYFQTNNNMESFLTSLLIYSFLVILIFTAHLTTRIDERGIHIQFFPFHFSFKTYPWEKIKSAELKKYSPIADYGGWGIRISMSGKGKAFNIRGNKGVYIQTTNGKKRMIGTQKVEEARIVLEQFNKNKID